MTGGSLAKPWWSVTSCSKDVGCFRFGAANKFLRSRRCSTGLRLRASIVGGEMNEASIRFPSALFASLGVLVCYFFGTRLYGPQTGLWAGLILATTTVYYTAGIEARVDMTLVFFVTLTLILFFSIYRGFLQQKIWWYVFFITAGASVTAKGPVSIILCGLVIASFLIIRKRWDIFRAMLGHPGMLLGALICVAWYVAALYLKGDEFFGLQFVKENFARFFVRGEGGTGHQKPFYYFIPYLFTLGMPWTLFLPGVIWSYFSDDSGRKDDLLFLGLWAVVVFLFFSLSAGKRPPYILPLYPAIALLTAVWLRDQSGGCVWKAKYYKVARRLRMSNRSCFCRRIGDLLSPTGDCSNAASARDNRGRERHPRNFTTVGDVALQRLACSRISPGRGAAVVSDRA